MRTIPCEVPIFSLWHFLVKMSQGFDYIFELLSLEKINFINFNMKCHSLIC